MAAIHTHRRALLAVLAGLPSTSLLAVLLSENIRHNATDTTGWLDTVTNQVLPLTGAYTAADPDFNGHATVLHDAYSQPLPGIVLPASEGFAATFVAKSTSGGQDSMWWYLDGTGGAIDLWRSDGTSLVLNTFGGSQYGVGGTDPDIDSSRLLVVTVVVPSGNTRGAQFYVNGVQMVADRDVNGIQDRVAAGTFYFGSISPAPMYKFLGRFSDLILQAGLPSRPEILAMHAYFKTKYAL